MTKTSKKAPKKKSDAGAAVAKDTTSEKPYKILTHKLVVKRGWFSHYVSVERNGAVVSLHLRKYEPTGESEFFLVDEEGNEGTAPDWSEDLDIWIENTLGPLDDKDLDWGKIVDSDARRPSQIAATPRAAGTETPGSPAVARRPWMSSFGEDACGSWCVVTVGGVELRLRWCPPGRFTMGSPETEEGRRKDEAQRKVELARGFWLGETVVTQHQWLAIMGPHASSNASPTCPVDTVSWIDCSSFLAKANASVQGLELRFPTEAEWEYACRAGTAGSTYLDGSSASLEDIMWSDENSGDSTHPVCTKTPNSWGLHDMLGGVFEWCGDWYGPYPKGASVDPVGPKTGENRCLRGGSYVNTSDMIRSARRHSWIPTKPSAMFGFRVAHPG